MLVEPEGKMEPIERVKESQFPKPWESGGESLCSQGSSHSAKP
jgi:hypothetical protein